MPVVLVKREDAEEYTIRDDDTLDSIAKAKCADLGWQGLARYNFGSQQTSEVLRAISELVGAKVKDLQSPGAFAEPETLKLKPDGELAPKLRIPKAWTKDNLTREKTHTIKVKPTLRPANAVSFEVDKWFVPGKEKCEITYQLEGSKDCADKLQLDVYGSNYCEATGWSNGLGTYGAVDHADVVDMPVYTLALNDQTDPGQEYSLPGDGWKGECNATKGMLSRKTGTAANRFVNVAFSPYTVHFRYYKAEADKTARILLNAFWLQFEEDKNENTGPSFTFATRRVAWNNAAKADRGCIIIEDKNGQVVHLSEIEDAKLAQGAQTFDWDGNYGCGAKNSRFGATIIDKPEDKPYSAKVITWKTKADTKADSRKIKWKVKNTTKLKRGRLQILDGEGKVVFEKPLKPALLTDGEHEFQWNGEYSTDIKNSAKGNKPIEKDMPYRVVIEASGIDQDKDEGLAIAVSHTEVRLYVHPKTAVPKDLLYDAEPWLATARQSLDLALAPYYSGATLAKADGVKYCQSKLNETGFHAGPVNNTAHAEYLVALKEFKRSVPKKRAVGDTYYKRLAINDDCNDETKDTIEELAGGLYTMYQRKPFGDLLRVLANNDDPHMTDAEVTTNLPSPGNDVIVWVDNRQYYTQGDARDDNNDPFMTGTPERSAFGLENYRAGMSARTGYSGLDAAAIARPWIPLRADIRLVGREQKLTDEVAKPNDTDRGHMRKAIGPLRVDWTFDDLPPDVSTINAGGYARRFTRSRAYVDWAIRSKKSDAHSRKDTGRETRYMNAKNDVGGIRDANASYYKAAFGVYDSTTDQSLAPWRATDVSATESIATIVHEHLALAQVADTDLFEPLLGAAGIYFHPSIIAGDGYRVRAELQFDKIDTKYEFPNLEVLKARYPKPPHAHTARLRLWRRSSIRGYACWSDTPTGHWPGTVAGFRDYYKAAHVYFVPEATNDLGSLSVDIGDVFDPLNDQAKYKGIIENNITDVDLKGLAKHQLRAADIWPWGHDDRLGWRWRSAVNIGDTRSDIYDKWLNKGIIQNGWRAFRDGLLLALTREIERKGYMRGHFFVEFRASPNYKVQSYKCANNHTYWYLYKKGVATPADQGRCKPPACNRTSRDDGGYDDNVDLPLPAVGCALGATWLFTSSDSGTWAHEVGHHRHLEHAASGPVENSPPSVPRQRTFTRLYHDSETNSLPVLDGGPDWGTMGVTNADEKTWERYCIMSYASSNYPGGTEYFCGKCLLMQRGWQVNALGHPGGAIGEPAP